jgi:hypothetical protein
MALPMLADFATRLGGGLAALLLVAPWKVVPPAFFRTHCLVILGLLVLAALDEGRSSSSHVIVGITIAAAVCAYLGSIAWGLGIQRLGAPLTALIIAGTVVVLIGASHQVAPGLWALIAADRLISAFLLGATLSAMLLGHHYLTAPAMSIDPLKRYVWLMAIALGLRATVGAIGLAVWSQSSATSPGTHQLSPLFLTMRWGMGIFAFALATWMAWKTVQIRSTQSATGILYCAMLLALSGELSALILSSDAGLAM